MQNGHDKAATPQSNLPDWAALGRLVRWGAIAGAAAEFEKRSVPPTGGRRDDRCFDAGSPPGRCASSSLPALRGVA